MGMRDFQEVVRHCRLTDMGYQGPLFTWCNKREEGLICKKLDRVLINEEWLNNSQAYSVFDSGGGSDHLSCQVQLKIEERKNRKPFKFTNAIASMPEFEVLIKEQWRGHKKLFHSTSAMYILTKWLKELKQPLRSLSKLKMGDFPKKTREAYQDLCSKHTLESPNQEKIKEELKAYTKWKRLADLEDEFPKQRSKVHWLGVGDGNNKVFHSSVKEREVRNAIHEILCAYGTMAVTDEDIKGEAERYYEEFMSIQPSDFEGVEVERLQSLLGFQCSEDDCRKLQREVTKEEIKAVIFKMAGNKAPGPDGFTSELFKSSWAVIGDDVTVAIQSFFIKGFLPKGLNSTILSLIPKKEEAKEMKDYRPISCCNVLDESHIYRFLH